MKLDKIIENLLFKYPLFGNIIINLNIEYSTMNIPAPAFTDGKTIYYRDDFLKNYDDEEKEFILAHEIYHIILKHFFRNVGKDADLLNYVEDAIINQLLVKDGLKMPKGLINVEDALKYSAEELYMKCLSNIKEIKLFMNYNTYHINLDEISEEIENILNKISNDSLDSIITLNEEYKDNLFNLYKNKLEQNNNTSKEHILNSAKRDEFLVGNIGLEDEILNWEELLESSLKVPDDDSVSFYIMDMDGIITKEIKYEETENETEIVVDSSGSMDIEKIKVILRECKNILKHSIIKIGFCDEEFYGWNEINSDDDINDLEIIGGGGTNLDIMSKSFSDTSINKIVITDGYGYFSENREDVLWIIFGTEIPHRYEIMPNMNIDINTVNYIFIDENKIKSGKKLILKN